MKKIDILAFGAHCDDVELACGGFLLKMKELGWTTGIIDLTRGEMNSKATPEVIAQEASKAAKILGTALRRTLDLGDARIEDTYENRVTISRIIREFQPNLVLAPYWKDRHNDHCMTGRLVKNSNLYCRLKKLGIPFPPCAPQLVLFYLLHDYYSPTIVIDITRYYSKKMEAIGAYRSQFGQKAAKMEVRPISVPEGKLSARNPSTARAATGSTCLSCSRVISAYATLTPHTSINIIKVKKRIFLKLLCLSFIIF